MIQHPCTESIKSTKIRTSESRNPKTVHIFSNEHKKKIYRVKVDGCYLNSNNTRKCDFLVFENLNNKAYLIELKGCSIKTALKQLNSTILELKSELSNYEIFCRVIVTRYNAPKLKVSPEYVKLIKLIGCSSKLIIKCRKLEESI